MSVVQFKLVREQRLDLEPMSIQYVKRKRKEDVDSSTTTTPLRPVRAPTTLFDPEIRSTISSSTVSSLVYKGLTQEQFCWKLRDYYNKVKPLFPNRTKILFMPGGNVFEDFVLQQMEKTLREENLLGKDSIRRQFNRDEIPRIYEQDLLARLRRQNFRYESREGFTNETSEDLKLFGRKVVSRTDGLLSTHVVEAKVPFGKLYKKFGSGTIVQEDGTKRYDKTQEIFEIPVHYKLQMLIQMNCYNRRKGYFGQYYIFENWKSFTDLLKSQYEKLQRGASLMTGTTIYRPTLDKTTPILTVLKRIANVIQRKLPILSDADMALMTAKEKRDRDNTRKSNESDALQAVWDYMNRFADYRIQSPSIRSDKEIKDKINQLRKEKELNNTEMVRQSISILKMQLLESNANRYKTAVEEIFRKNPSWLKNMIKAADYTTLDYLTNNPSEKQEILDILQYGKKQDIQRGVVTFTGEIMWDGESKAEPMPSSVILSGWIRDVMKVILPRVSRKDPEKWKAFEEELVRGDSLRFDLYPTMSSYGQFQGYGEYNELVILEMEPDYDTAMRQLKQFMYQCDRTVKYRIPCKSRKAKNPLTGEKVLEKMTGKDIGYRDKFIEYLEKIPVKLVARREVQI